jgi:hypothetical protein
MLCFFDCEKLTVELSKVKSITKVVQYRLLIGI